MVVICQIDFDNNPQGIYFAGQILSGQVVMTVDKPKRVNGISLHIIGYANTNWSEKKGSGHSKRTVHYSGREDYIGSITYLLGSEQSQTLTIPAGIHTYNFTSHIPPTCPSSFEGEHGHIRYLIKIALVRPWKFNQTYTKGFTVLKVMDLNYESPLLRVPSNMEVQKTFCFGPCRSEPLKLEVNLARNGFVPGEHIPITVLATNDSHVPIDEIKIALVMLVCYYSQPPRANCKNVNVTIAKMKCAGVPKQCKKQFQCELLVPATPPTCFNLCRILQVGYQVHVEAKVKGVHANQVITTPVTIGNVPLMIGVIQQQPLSQQRNVLDETATTSNGINSSANKELNDAVENQEEVFMPWNSNTNMPPPSYEEATHLSHACINADESHDYGESDFVPRYPVFHLAETLEASASATGIDEFDSSKAGDGTWL